MTDIDRALGSAREALDDFVAAGHRSEAVWMQAPAPGKWSPSQITEHVARALEESAHTAAGRPSKFPVFPSFVHPIARALFFNRVLRNKTFPKAKTTKPMNPTVGPATPAEGRVRLEGALAEFEQACRQCLGDGRCVRSTIFGEVSVLDYVRFQELHIRHHRGQMR